MCGQLAEFFTFIREAKFFQYTKVMVPEAILPL